MIKESKNKRWHGKPIGLRLIEDEISSMSNSCFFVFQCLVVFIMWASTSLYSCCNACDKQWNNTVLFSYGVEIGIRCFKTVWLIFDENMDVVDRLECRVINGNREWKRTVGYRRDCLSTKVLLMRLKATMWWGSLTQPHDFMIGYKGSIRGGFARGTMAYEIRMICDTQVVWLFKKNYWIMSRVIYLKYEGKGVSGNLWCNILNNIKGNWIYLGNVCIYALENNFRTYSMLAYTRIIKEIQVSIKGLIIPEFKSSREHF